MGFLRAADMPGLRTGVLRHHFRIAFLQPAGQEVDIVFGGIVFQEVSRFGAGAYPAQGGGGSRFDGGIVRIHCPFQHGGFGCKESLGRHRRTELCAIGLSFLYQGQESLVTAFQLRQGIQGRGGQGRILGVCRQLRDVFFARQQAELAHQEIGIGRVLCFGYRLFQLRLHRGFSGRADASFTRAANSVSGCWARAVTAARTRVRRVDRIFFILLRV